MIEGLRQVWEYRNFYIVNEDDRWFVSDLIGKVEVPNKLAGFEYIDAPLARYARI